MDEQEIIDKFFTKLIAIHLTNYFPQNGIIKTRFFTAPKTWLRDTLHFSTNKPVEDISSFSSIKKGGSSWKVRNFAILIPFDRLYQNHPGKLQTLSGKDTFFIGNITIPEGSTIIVMSTGIQELINNKIISNEEHNKLIELFKISTKVGRDFIFKKTVNGINYRIYHGHKKIKPVVSEVIKILGYEAKGITMICSQTLKIGILEVDKILGLGRESHGDHWTSDLEQITADIDSFKEEINFLVRAIAHLKERNIIFPTYPQGYYKKDGMEISKKNKTYVDSKGRVFNGTIIADFPIIELNAFDTLFRSSVEYSDNSINTFQSPFRKVKSALKKYPQKYLPAIKDHIRDYQEHIKKYFPKNLIGYCPNLKKYLKEDY
ncbi:hypothetical protein HOC80_00180 [archaeon]|jgi:hypothetical protein|nr:hypothetical protein [archaeon]MBT4416501.1 hypothetical protein [archaeon]